MKLSIIALVLLMFASPAFAADIDGKWTGSISGPGGDFQLAYTFKADGNKLTGTTLGLDGAEVPLKDGKIEGANISFSVTLDFGGMPLTLSYKAVMTGDQMKMTGDMMGQPFEFALKKEAAKK